jgi:hypothetical protein
MLCLTHCCCCAQDENVKVVQTVSFIAMWLLIGEFIVFFIVQGFGSNPDNQFHSIPMFGDQYSQLISVFIFTWAVSLLGMLIDQYASFIIKKFRKTEFR